MRADDPIVADAKAVRPLTGLSGATVILMTKDERHWFVRKVARDAAASARLRRQAAKQRAAADLLAGVARTPRILDEGELDGRYFFDMEFVRGADGVTFLRRATYDQVVGLGDRLCRYLEVVGALPPVAAPAPASLFDALYGKLCEVQGKTGLLDGAVLARLFLALDGLRRAGGGPAPTLCHGDLTLENLVVDDRGELWLLDLLDAPFEHAWQDVAKLHQDLEGGWYLLTQPPVARAVLAYLSQRVLAAAARLDPGYPDVHAVLLACTFARILPYARTAEARAFVNQRVEHFARLARVEGEPRGVR